VAPLRTVELVWSGFLCELLWCSSSDLCGAASLVTACCGLPLQTLAEFSCGDLAPLIFCFSLSFIAASREDVRTVFDGGETCVLKSEDV
jgi:hypothetical protein